MAGGRSQRHKFYVQGEASDGRRLEDLVTAPPAPSVEIKTTNGGTIIPAELAFGGVWAGTETVTVGISTDTSAGQTTGPVAVPAGAASGVAAAVATAIDALVDVDATANGAEVDIVAINTALTITIDSAVIA